MKKIYFAAPLMAMAALLTACEPSKDDISADVTTLTAEELTEALQVVPKREGNNNFTIYTNPSHYIHVFDADGNEVGAGMSVQTQELPGTTEAKYYVTTLGADGTLVQSNIISKPISEYTDLDPMLEVIFGDGTNTQTFVERKYTWNTEASDGVWGNGGHLGNTGPGWWVVLADQIDEQAAGKGMDQDGLNGWFTLKLGAGGVKTSRGETGSVKATSAMLQEGWDMGTLIFSKTVPLLGIQPNAGGRQYVYQILKFDDTELRLSAPEPGAGAWGTGWFWNFKRVSE